MGKIVPRGTYSFYWIYTYVYSIINSKVFENIFGLAERHSLTVSQEIGGWGWGCLPVDSEQWAVIRNGPRVWFLFMLLLCAEREKLSARHLRCGQRPSTGRVRGVGYPPFARKTAKGG
jgi:hypothetical protein